MTSEPVDRRVLGAVRYVDAPTGLPVADRLTVTAGGVSWIRNLHNYYAVASTRELQAHAEAFDDPPATPPLESVAFEVTVTDPGRHYLPRRHTIRLPRDADPAHASQTGSLFQSMDVALYPAPSAAVRPGWAVVHATVTGAGPETRLAGALIRVIRVSDDSRIAGGLSDGRGEALVAVPGIPVTTWGEDAGPVLATEVEARLEVVFDPASGPVPDPDDLEARRDELRLKSSTVMLASGRAITVRL